MPFLQYISCGIKKSEGRIATEKIKKDDYLEIGTGELKEQYRVTGYDIQSTPGVEYVTVDPTYEYDLTPAPQQQPGDSEDDFFWLNGGE